MSQFACKVAEIKSYKCMLSEILENIRNKKDTNQPCKEISILARTIAKPLLFVMLTYLMMQFVVQEFNHYLIIIKSTFYRGESIKTPGI